MTNHPPARPLPGDLPTDTAVHRMIRVDHAGEYGAARIYAGQLAVLGRSASADQLRHMRDQEQVHLDTFNAVLADRHVRPSALLPFWHLAGFALGAATAALGQRAAMACTVAVEETIDAHYTAQIDRLPGSEAALRDTLTEFRAEEREHRDIALANDAEQAPGYRLLSAAIRTGCRIAIRLSERL
ncbi:MAG TPA: demethoxyubiquinone hydroxylase family protein [Acetobacteraceae bacterium]|nr:demethoxyubiquinone hydroxylase family protein [Acetobacteraceae bacterium]